MIAGDFIQRGGSIRVQDLSSNDKITLDTSSIRVNHSVDELPMSLPELRYPPDLSGTTLTDGTDISSGTSISTDLNNPTEVVVSGEPYGNGTYGFVCGDTSNSNVFNLLNSSFENFFQAGDNSKDFDLFNNDDLNNSSGVVFGIYYPKPTKINSFDIRCDVSGSGPNDKFVEKVIIRASNSLEDVGDGIATDLSSIDTSDTSDNSLKKFDFSNNEFYKYYFFSFINEDGRPLNTNIFHPYGQSDTLGLQYPPVDLSSNDSTIIGQQYGNGVYSSRVNGAILDDDGVRNPYYAFDRTENEYQTFDAYNVSNTQIGDEIEISSNLVEAGKEDYIISLDSKEGTGLDIEFPNTVLINVYGVRTRNDTGSDVIPPSRWILYGSNDGSQWTSLDDQTSRKLEVDYENEAFALIGGNYLRVSNPGYYKYYRLFVTNFINTFSDKREYIGFKIGDIELFGLPILDKLYRFPPRGLTANEDTIEGEAYGNGVYDISFSSAFTDDVTKPHHAFDHKTTSPEDDDNAFVTDGSNNSYDNSGNVNTAEAPEIIPGLYGEYLILKSPKSFYLNNYRMFTRKNSGSRGDPKSWVILGSNDGINWDIIDIQTDVSSPDAGTFYPQQFIVNTSKSYSHYAMSVQKITYGSQYGTEFNGWSLAEWELYGTPLDSALIQSEGDSQTLQLAPQPTGRVIVGEETDFTLNDKAKLQINAKGKNESLFLISNDRGQNRSGMILGGGQVDYYGIIQDESVNLNLQIVAGDRDVLTTTSLSSGKIKKIINITKEGNIGIGTTNPSESLEVSGNVKISSGTNGDCVLTLEADTDNNNENDHPRIEFHQDGGIEGSAIYNGHNELNIANSYATYQGIVFLTGTKNGYTNANERMRIDGDGNVGIGTNNPSANLEIRQDFDQSENSIPWTALLLYRDISGDMGQGDLEPIFIDFKWKDDNDNNYPQARIGAVLNPEGKTGRIQEGRGALVFHTAQAKDDIDAESDELKERMRIDTSGNVGIGTTAPQQKLEVNDGRLRIDGVDKSGILELKSDSSINFIFTNDNSDHNLYLRTTDDSDIILVDDGGNVGIGTTQPDAKLHIAGGNYQDLTDFRIGNENNYLAVGVAIGGNGAGNTFVNTVGDGTDKLIFQNNSKRTSFGGKVGIGTSTPRSKLEVKSSNTSTDIVNDISNEITTNFHCNNTLLVIGESTENNNTSIQINSLDADDQTTAKNLVFCRGGGNVGIATNKPLYTLDVSGDIGVNNIFASNLSDYAFSSTDIKTEDLPIEILTQTEGNQNYVKKTGSGNEILQKSLIVNNGETDHTEQGVRITTSGDKGFIESGYTENENKISKKLIISQWESSTAVATFDTDNKRVGIGTESPRDKLEVKGGLAYFTDGINIGNNSLGAQIYSGTYDTTSSELRFIGQYNSSGTNSNVGFILETLVQEGGNGCFNFTSGVIRTDASSNISRIRAQSKVMHYSENDTNMIHQIEFHYQKDSAGFVNIYIDPAFPIQTHGFKLTLFDRLSNNSFTPATDSNAIGKKSDEPQFVNFLNANGSINDGIFWKSDDRLKDNEIFIENATNTIMKLRPQLYDKKSRLPKQSRDDLSNNFTISKQETIEIESEKESGLIAQEIWYDAPELRHLVHTKYADISAIDEPPDDYYETRDDPEKDPDYSAWGKIPAGVNYTGLIPYVVRSVQELNQRLERSERSMLNERIHQLEADNAKLRQEMQEYKQSVDALIEKKLQYFKSNTDLAYDE